MNFEVLRNAWHHSNFKNEDETKTKNWNIKLVCPKIEKQKNQYCCQNLHLRKHTIEALQQKDVFQFSNF